jgi:hypothetical protein
MGNWFDSHYQLQALVPCGLPTHNNISPQLVHRLLANDGLVSPIPFSHHVPREIFHNSPQDMTAMIMADMGNKTSSPAANASSLKVAAPSTTPSRRSWPQVIVKDGEIWCLNIQILFEGQAH